MPSFLLVLLLLIAIVPSTAVAILVIGATGTTGLRAIRGLLDAGWKPQQIRLVTRNSSKPNMLQLRDELGFDVIQANLEVPSTLEGISKGCTGCYIHSTSNDTPDLDVKEVERAQNLCNALVKQESVGHVVYNSAAAGPNHNVKRIAQKHGVEEIFQQEPSLSFSSLRANLFMEELWKGYTRPQILEGNYPLPAHRNKQLYFTSVRDMGQLAGRLLKEPDAREHKKLVINVASDCLTGPQIADAFAEAQGSTCLYFRPWRMEVKAWLKYPELHEQIQFIKKNAEVTDVKLLKERYPDLLTSFSEFLTETKWGDRDRTFSSFSEVSNLMEQ
mmetsp:Transcript_21820/g.47503  ORF Transcript_21820/g.47503 Transcript_21820/m.47503 type:complete len:330 (-) Transcript_21820:358-1347(-)